MAVGAYLRSSIGKKQMMAITGLLWCGFVTGHMVGNLLFLIGPEAFNAYGHAITGNKPIYYTIEAILLSTLLLHIFFAVLVVLDNRRAKPVGYAVTPRGDSKGAVTLAAKTMKYSGAVILLFVVLHLITFRFGVYYSFPHKGEDIRDLYRLMEEVFASAGYVGFYLLCLLILAFHLSHALWSSVQSLGLIPDGKEAKLRCASLAFGWVVALGFAVNPIIIFIRG
jgi:succinate dehydrogenase / fumarate reductase, cytochrome b subunit